MGFDALSFALGRKSVKGTSGEGFIEGVHFVTFMSEDGTTELYKRPVADGDDCADPVKRGLMEEPTKESTAQYAYTHAGWSASPNGALSSNILKAVKADKAVYANFAAVLRYYTVTFYDSDGVTVLGTKTAAYGSVPSFAPTAPSGYMLSAWVPELSEVTGDTSYTAVWKELPVFAASSWSEIAAVCEAGNAANFYALGDTKEITLTNGRKVTAEIIGFNHDDLADGSGKAPLTLWVRNGNVETYNWSFSKGTNWTGAIRTKVKAQLDLLPEDLKALIKDVTKKTMLGRTQAEYNANEFVTSTENIWLPSQAELTGVTTYVTDGPQYSHFKTAANRIGYINGTATDYYVRSTPTSWNNYPICIGTNGSKKNVVAGGTYRVPLFIGFCI